MNNIFVATFLTLVCVVFFAIFCINLFKRFVLIIPIFAVILIGLAGFFLNLIKIGSLNMIAPLAFFCVVLLILLEYGLEAEDDIKISSFLIFVSKERRHENPKITAKDIGKSQWNKNLLIFSAVFTVEQIFAYTANFTFFKYYVLISNGSEYQSSSLAIPLSIAILYHFSVKLYKKAKTSK